jgi:hypothetical protein
VNISVGISKGGSSSEGLQDLVDAVSGTGKLWVFHNEATSFHPKIYLFRNANAAELVVGSGNLTEGGLYTNYEAGIRLALNLDDPKERSTLLAVERALDAWSTPRPGVCFPLDAAFLKRLVAAGKVPTEEKSSEPKENSSTTPTETSHEESLFKAIRVRPAPKTPSTGKLRRRLATPRAIIAPASVPPITVTTTGLHTFVMTLQRTDAGYGQVRAGTARRSPEIFVPIRAVDAEPAFWGWPDQFVIDKAWLKAHTEWIRSKRVKRRSSRPLRKLDRNGVVIKIVNSGALVRAAIWYNPDKVDLRIRQEQLRSAGKVGDILVLRAAPTGAAYDYEFEVVSPTDRRFKRLFKACSIMAGANSKKRYGYI